MNTKSLLLATLIAISTGSSFAMHPENPHNYSIVGRPIEEKSEQASTHAGELVSKDKLGPLPSAPAHILPKREPLGKGTRITLDQLDPGAAALMKHLKVEKNVRITRHGDWFTHINLSDFSSFDTYNRMEGVMNRVIPNKKLSKKKLGQQAHLASAKEILLTCAQTGNIMRLYQILGFNTKECQLIKQAKDENGNTALHLGAQAGHLKVVQLLLEDQLNPLALNVAGKTPRILAQENNQSEIVELLLQAEQKIAQQQKQADAKKTEIKRPLDQAEQKLNAVQKRKAKRDAKRTELADAKLQAELVVKQQQEKAQEEALKQQRMMQEKHEHELREYFRKAVAEDDDGLWIEVLITKTYRIPGSGKEIEGHYFTKHVLERMAPDTPEVRAQLERRAKEMGLERGTEKFEKHVQPRGITAAQILQTIRTGIADRTHNEAIIYKKDGLKVVVAQDGAIITAVWE